MYCPFDFFSPDMNQIEEPSTWIKLPPNVCHQSFLCITISWPRRVLKCPHHEHYTHNLAASSQWQVVAARCAAYFWANLPKLRSTPLCHTLFQSTVPLPLTNPTLSVTREGAAVRCCTEARGTNSSKVSAAAGDAIWEISCWVLGVEKKEEDLEK